MQNAQHATPVIPGSPVAAGDRSTAAGDRSTAGVDVPEIDGLLNALDDADLTTHAGTLSRIHDALTRALAVTTPESAGPAGRPQGP